MTSRLISCPRCDAIVKIDYQDNCPKCGLKNFGEYIYMEKMLNKAMAQAKIKAIMDSIDWSKYETI